MRARRRKRRKKKRRVTLSSQTLFLLRRTLRSCEQYSHGPRHAFRVVKPHSDWTCFGLHCSSEKRQSDTTLSPGRLGDGNSWANSPRHPAPQLSHYMYPWGGDTPQLLFLSSVTAVCRSTCLLLFLSLLTATLFIKLRKGVFKLPRGAAADMERAAANERAGGVSAVKMIYEFIVAY